MTRRVRTERAYELGDDCGHWTLEMAAEEPRVVDELLMSDEAYYAAHGLDGSGEVWLCLLSPAGWEVVHWCSTHGEWEDGENRRLCALMVDAR